MDCAITDAVMIGYGPFEAYGFHALEGLQCMVERRKGGETGVQGGAVSTGEAMWQGPGRGPLVEGGARGSDEKRAGARQGRLPRGAPQERTPACF